MVLYIKVKFLMINNEVMQMTGLERTLNFINGSTVDRLPFHPIMMRIVSHIPGVNYRDYCIDPQQHCDAAVEMAEKLNLDWVTVMSDPYAESEAFGMEIDYPDNALPHEKGLLINDPMVDIDKLTVPNWKEHYRLKGRIEQIANFSSNGNDQYFIVGWVEGAVAEYADLRGLGDTCMDFYDCPEKVNQALDIITESALNLITAQVEAGAHCIGIGDAVCSQIGPELYKEFAYEREKVLVDHIHSLGALAKIHICGDTTKIVPYLAQSGADIIDIDHLASDMKLFASYLNDSQVLSGNIDPVSIIANGSPEQIKAYVKNTHKQTNGRTIVSAGCEIVPDTPIENLKAFYESTNIV
jgi:MtaA/CmuA family methyltransferase